MATIQVRDIPDETYEVLRARAKADGRSIQSYMLAWVIELAARPTTTEVLDRASRRTERARASVVDALEQGRVERDQQLDEMLGSSSTPDAVAGR